MCIWEWWIGGWVGVIGAFTGFVCPSPASECMWPHIGHTWDCVQMSAFGLLEPLHGPVQELGVPRSLCPCSLLSLTNDWLVQECERPAPLRWVQTDSQARAYPRAPVRSGQAGVFASTHTLSWLLLMSFSVSLTPFLVSPGGYVLTKLPACESSSLLENFSQEVEMAHLDWWAEKASLRKYHVHHVTRRSQSWQDVKAMRWEWALRVGGTKEDSVTSEWLRGRPGGEAPPSVGLRAGSWARNLIPTFSVPLNGGRS